MAAIKWILLVAILVLPTGCNRNKEDNAAPPPGAAANQSAASDQPDAAVPPPVATNQQDVTMEQTTRSPEPIVQSKKKDQAPAEKIKKTIDQPVKSSEPAQETAGASSQEISKSETAMTSAAGDGNGSKRVADEVRSPQYAVIPAGTILHIRLQDPLDSAVNITGDTFRAILDREIEINGAVVVPRGSLLDGKLSHVQRSGRVQGLATMSLQLLNLRIDEEQAYAIQTEIRTFEAESTKKKDVGKVGIGAGLGAVIGAIAGGGKGAAIGAAAGAGAGGAAVMATRGEEAKLNSEQIIEFALQRDLKIQSNP